MTFAAGLILGAFLVALFTVPPYTGQLLNKAWRVYNKEPVRVYTRNVGIVREGRVRQDGIELSIWPGELITVPLDQIEEINGEMAVFI